MTTATRDTSRRYTVQTMSRARELREAGWSYREIRERLHLELGVAPALTVLTRWCDPVQAERARERQRRWLRERQVKDARFMLPGRTPEYRDAFARRLKAEGVPVPSIVKASRVVFEAPMTDGEVRDALGLVRR